MWYRNSKNSKLNESIKKGKFSYNRMEKSGELLCRPPIKQYMLINEEEICENRNVALQKNTS